MNSKRLGGSRFTTKQDSLWTGLDPAAGSDLDENDEEAREFDRQAGASIDQKLRDIKAVEPKLLETIHIPPEAADDNRTEVVHTHSLATVSPDLQSQAQELQQTAHTAIDIGNVGETVAATPRAIASNKAPHVPTPSEITPALPRPRIIDHLPGKSHIRALETPDHVPSPIDTPVTIHTEGQAGRTEPDTPLPIGSRPFASLRGKQDLQTLTKHFEAFNKATRKQSAAVPMAKGGPSKSRGGKVAAHPALGGRIFEGFRFCVPPEIGQVTKHKQRWDIIAKLGGQVTLQPDTAITHVVYDRSSASILCRELGIRTLSELPHGTVCVKWEWVVSCKLAGRALDPTAWLSFPANAFTRTTSARAFSIGTKAVTGPELLKGRSISISRKRPNTASESDTDSPKRPFRQPGREILTALSISRGHLKRRSEVEVTGFPAEAGPSSSLSRLLLVSTTHELPTGLGWEAASGGQEDGLDTMISGVKNGVAEDEGSLSDQEQLAEEKSAPPTSPAPEVLDDDDHNPSIWADRFRCGQRNDGNSAKGPNEWLATKFEEMHDIYLGVQGKNQFATRQYSQAASILRRTVLQITSGAQAMTIKGIGKSIADRIDEFISGEPGRLFYENGEQAQIIQSFREIYGIGRNLANELYRRGARSIDDLRNGHFGLTYGQRVGLDLYDDLKSRIPRSESRQIFELIRTETEAIDSKVWIEIMGSYRRGQDTSGDVDILITRDPSDGITHAEVLNRLVKALKEKGIITHDLSLPYEWKALEAKWMGVCRVNSESKYRRLDILCIPFEYWGGALIYFTGNDIFNRSLRLYARKKGYSLNQRGLSKGVIRGKDGLRQTEGEIVASRTEQEIFDVLGLRWRHPHHRRP